MLNEYILYACPTGPLANSIEAYFRSANVHCGPNSAHRYMPHISLTGFFHDQPTSLPFYKQALDSAYQHIDRQLLLQPCQIRQLLLNEDFHGLLIEGPLLKQFSADFARLAANSATRSDPIRLKDWLHLSFAYGFATEQATCLITLAQQIDLALPVGWDLCFYERQAGDHWILHHHLPLNQALVHG